MMVPRSVQRGTAKKSPTPSKDGKQTVQTRQTEQSKSQKEEKIYQTLVTEQPTLVTEQPTLVTEQQMMVMEQPMLVTEQPTLVTEQPTLVTEQPMLVTEQPMLVTEQPTLVMEQPTLVTEQPMLVTEQPTLVTEQPMLVTEPPRQTEQDRPIGSRSKEDVNEVLTDIVVVDSLSDTDVGKVLKFPCKVQADSQTVAKNVSAAISQQPNPPVVEVGALSPSKHVPVYSRHKRPAPERHVSDNIYNDLYWQPSSRYAPSTSRQLTTEERHGVKRDWDYTEMGTYYMQRPEKHRGFIFTVMSYNVLAQDLLEDHRNMYSRCPPEVLDWDKRKRILLGELSRNRPDVICLQEVQCNHYDHFFLPELQKLGYVGVYLKRTGHKTDGCATFYVGSMFHIVDRIEVPYRFKRGGCYDLNRENVGLIVKLRVNSSKVNPSTVIVVANTHLLFNPRRGDIKLAQLMMLFAEIDACAYLNDGLNVYQPLIVCGDFNSVPHSELYKLVVMGKLDYEGILCRDVAGQAESCYRSGSAAVLHADFVPKAAGISDNCQYCEIAYNRFGLNDYNMLNLGCQGTGQLKQNLRLVSAYTHRCRRRGRYYEEVSTHHGNASCNVDYIFYGVQSGLVRFYKGEVQTSNVQDGHLSLLATYSLLCDKELSGIGSLPNRQFGSDHISLMAKFLLT